jgi:WD40 repeat protein
LSHIHIHIPLSLSRTLSLEFSFDRVWAIHSGSLHGDPLVVYENGESEINAVALTVAGDESSNVTALMIVGLADGRLACVDQRSGRCVSQFRAHDEAVVNVYVSAEGGILSADRGGHWRRQTLDGVVLSEGQCERELGSMLSDGKQLLLGRSDGIVELWDAVSGERSIPLTGKHTGPCVCMYLTLAGEGGSAPTLLTGGVDGFVRTWRS